MAAYRSHPLHDADAKELSGSDRSPGSVSRSSAGWLRWCSRTMLVTVHDLIHQIYKLGSKGITFLLLDVFHDVRRQSHALGNQIVAKDQTGSPPGSCWKDALLSRTSI